MKIELNGENGRCGRAGTDGQAGWDGGNGSDGGDARDARDVSGTIESVGSKVNLNLNGKLYNLTGVTTLEVRGGEAGWGGRGGKGGKTKQGSSLLDGKDGRRGRHGQAGRGGNVTIRANNPFLYNLLKVENRGGLADNGIFGTNKKYAASGTYRFSYDGVDIGAPVALDISPFQIESNDYSNGMLTRSSSFKFSPLQVSNHNNFEIPECIINISSKELGIDINVKFKKIGPRQSISLPIDRECIVPDDISFGEHCVEVRGTHVVLPGVGLTVFEQKKQSIGINYRFLETEISNESCKTVFTDLNEEKYWVQYASVILLNTITFFDEQDLKEKKITSLLNKIVKKALVVAPLPVTIVTAQEQFKEQLAQANPINLLKDQLKSGSLVTPVKIPNPNMAQLEIFKPIAQDIFNKAESIKSDKNVNLQVLSFFGKLPEATKQIAINLTMTIANVDGVLEQEEKNHIRAFVKELGEEEWAKKVFEKLYVEGDSKITIKDRLTQSTKEKREKLIKHCQPAIDIYNKIKPYLFKYTITPLFKCIKGLISKKNDSGSSSKKSNSDSPSKENDSDSPSKKSNSDSPSKKNDSGSPSKENDSDQ